ncbi:MAG: CRISPR-associated endonuclease Cas2 [Verrucomicrobiia bacterium]
MRTTYIVTYDIADAKRLRRVFKVCKNHGAHLQFSVFECDLNPAERTQLEAELGAEINHAEDQVLFIALGPADGRGSRSISALGQPYTPWDSPCYVV